MAISLDLATRDFELIELLTGGQLLLNNANPRTTADGATTTASPTVTSATMAFTAGDIGGTITGTGIPAAATIISVNSPTSAVMSANATATASGVSITVTPVTTNVGIARRGIGLGNPPFVSLEIWTTSIDDAGVCSTGGNPGWFRVIYPRATFTLGDSTFENGVAVVSLSGFGTQNPLWGNGPFNDYPASGTLPANTPEAILLDSAGPPALANGYTTVPAQ